MVFIDHLKGNDPDLKVLEVAFGYHIIEGDLAKSIVTGASPNHIVTVQQLIGEAYGKGWSGPLGVWFRGVNRPAAKFKFYPGIQSPNPVWKTFTADSATDTLTSTAHGFANGTMVIFDEGNLPGGLVAERIRYVINTAVNTFQVALTSGGAVIDLTSNGSGTLRVRENSAIQGVDPVFFEDTPHSNTAWIRAECPNGSEVGIPNINTKDNPPTGLTGIYGCQLGDIYNSSGAVTSSNVLVTNPADVLAFGCMEIRRYANSRVDWAVLDTLRTACNQSETPDYTTLSEGVGLTARYYDGSAFNTFKSRRVDPVIQFVPSTGAPALDINVDSFSARYEGKIRPKYNETYTFYLTHDDGGRLWINDLTTPLIDQWGTLGTHSATFAVSSRDQFFDIKMEWNETGGSSEFKLEWESPSQPRQVVPQDRLYPKNEAKTRFECHAAFTQRTTFDQFLRSVLFNCNSTMQNDNGKWKFICLSDTTHSFDFSESNIVKDTFKYYPRFSQQELLSLPNRLIADGRDLESRYLEKFDPRVFYELADLQSLAGRINEEVVFIGNTTRWQAIKNLTHYARLKTSPLVCEFEGMPQTLAVLPGDKVRVTHSLPNWTNKQFLVIEATEKSIDRGSDARIFKLLEWT